MTDKAIIATVTSISRIIAPRFGGIFKFIRSPDNICALARSGFIEGTKEGKFWRFLRANVSQWIRKQTQESVLAQIKESQNRDHARKTLAKKNKGGK